ncbi:isoprenoid synthase domain-containing protein [Aspergillus pseudoustus]|uniref:Isoprenoid synthase domain-containing protein n=1 Tax=Aspergillus pseudoustus TaxID=1810923 RepID=A0ABR4JEP0_9EURO
MPLFMYRSDPPSSTSVLLYLFHYFLSFDGMEPLSAESFRRIVRSFLDEVDFHVHFEKPRQNVLDQAYSTLQSLPHWQAGWNNYIVVSYEVVRLMVPHLCDDAQAQITIKYALGLLIDDKPSLFVPGIQFSSGRLIQTDHVGYDYACAIFAAVDRLQEWYEPFIVSIIWKSWFQWMIFLPYETQETASLASVPSEHFINYTRHLTTVADSTSCVVFNNGSDAKEFVQLIPDMTAFVIEINDFLSFYKESIVGNDCYNVIIQRQRLHQETYEQVIQQSRDACLEIMKRLCSAPVSARMRELVRQFVAGYVKFYLGVTRYRLKELFSNKV